MAIETVHWTDDTQTVGARPLNVSLVQPDMLVVHSYKSMLCHYGLGFAYLGSRFDTGQPLEESWLVRRGAEDFSRLVDYQDDYADGMRRYDSSLRANPVLVRSLIAAAGELVAWQPACIETWCRAITAGFVAQALEIGFAVAEEGARAANIFGLRAPAGLDQDRVRTELAARQIYVSIRGSAIRVSPHVYNDEADLARLADALRRVLQR